MQLISDITNSLSVQGVKKIVLFGSYAYGQPTNDSDLDLIVITNDEFIPRSNKEKMELHHKYNKLIKPYRKQISIDLLVYTKVMFSKLLETGSLFSQEINQKGKVLYEEFNKGMA